MSTVDPARAGGTTDPYPPGAPARDYPYTDDVSHGDGWVLFAGALLVMVGILNTIDGIAAISNSKFFVGDAKYIFSDLNTWGWIVLVLGAIQGLTGIGVVLRVRGVRWIGVTFASLNAIAQLFFLPAYPFLSLSLFTLDILIIYGLIAYGSRVDRA
jgi:hypothetical protein